MWEDCTDNVDYAAGDQLLYMEPIYNFLLCVALSACVCACMDVHVWAAGGCSDHHSMRLTTSKCATNQTHSAATDGKLRILLISGDDDAVCGTRGTELWLTRMG